MSDSSPDPEKAEEVYAHYVSRGELERAVGAGRPAVAICGTTWQAGRSTTHYPVCPECEKKMSDLLRW